MFSVLRNMFTSQPPPTKVCVMKPNVYTQSVIHLREDSLILYLPKDKSDIGDKTNLHYDIVLHRPIDETSTGTFSIYRTQDQDDAEAKFVIFKDKLPTLVEISKEMCNVYGIQKICDVLLEHPAWTLAHLAAHFALYDALSNSKITTYLNSTDDETGMSPLQVAIITDNLKTVQIMVAANCSLEHIDHEGNSVYHYAASTNKDIISLLSQSSTLCLSARNKNGYTPLHMACLSDKPDCVKALLVAGADVNKTAINAENDMEPGYVGTFFQDHPPHVLYNKDMKYGGTPLHWAQSRLVIEALLDMNCHINSVNFDKKTALHIMVLRNRLECAVTLLSREADANIPDANGDRPLHLAIKEGNLSIIQCLIVFGADLNLTNNTGETPRHIITKEQESKLLYYLHAVGAKRCQMGVTNCTDGCKYEGTYDGIPPPTILGPTNRDVLNQMLAVAGMEVASEKYKNGQFPTHGRLLCLDGGGIKGLVLVEMLLELEKLLKNSIGKYFDWIAGTSTGGILALGIASGKSMRECLCLYFRLKEVTFIGSRPYPSEPLEKVLKDTFGTETVMADIKHPKVIITGVLADRKPVDLHIFRNYESPSEILNVQHNSAFELPLPPQEQYMWQVARATGAAPTYFRSYGRYLDGGLIANNPTLDALTEVHEYCLALKAVGRQNEATTLSVVVSLGTGQPPVKTIKEIDVFRPDSILDGAKLVFGVSALGHLLVDQATQSDGRVVDRARAWCSSIGVPYFRFSPLLSEDIALNEKSDEKLCAMLWETKAYMRDNYQILRELADLLSK